MIIAIQLDAESLCLGQNFEVHLPQTRPGGKSLSGPIMGPNESLARTVSWVVQWQVSFPNRGRPLGRNGKIEIKSKISKHDVSMDSMAMAISEGLWY